MALSLSLNLAKGHAFGGGWGARAARHGGGAMEQVFAKARELAKLYEKAHLAIESDQALREDMLRGLMDEGVV